MSLLSWVQKSASVLRKLFRKRQLDKLTKKVFRIQVFQFWNIFLQIQILESSHSGISDGQRWETCPVCKYTTSSSYLKSNINDSTSVFSVCSPASVTLRKLFNNTIRLPFVMSTAIILNTICLPPFFYNVNTNNFWLALVNATWHSIYLYFLQSLHFSFICKMLDLCYKNVGLKDILKVATSLQALSAMVRLCY